MIEDLVRKHLKTFAPYTSARSEVRSGDLLLDANELSIGSAVTLDGIPLNRYPDPNQIELRDLIARTLGFTSDSIFVGAGSDEVIDLLIRLFCEPGKENILVVEPTYGVYRVAAAVSGVESLTAELDERFQLDPKGILDAVRSSTKIIFLCSPNNPTGNLLKREDIVALCSKTSAMVVVDQAYLEFARADGDISRELSQNSNLIILRTLSKGWGLAGIRLGYCIADSTVVSYLLRIKAPYNINAVTSRLAIDALKNSEFLLKAREDVTHERNRLETSMKTIAAVRQVYPSDANFLLVEFGNAADVYNHLLDRGIVVRRRSEPRLKNCLRITVGTVEENDRVLRALKDFQ